jgi:hypothetical protein
LLSTGGLFYRREDDCMRCHAKPDLDWTENMLNSAQRRKLKN